MYVYMLWAGWQKLSFVQFNSISTWGHKTLQIKFGQTRFTHRFLLADVANPILGMDFFTQFNLLISPPPLPQVTVPVHPG